MDDPALGHFLKCARRQRQPLGLDAKKDGGSFGRPGEFLWLREMGRPFPAVVLWQRAIKQLQAGIRVNRTVPAVNKLLQFRALAVAIYAYVMPAGVNLRRQTGARARILFGA